MEQLAGAASVLILVLAYMLLVQAMTAAAVLLVLQPHLLFASLVVCASRSGLMASAPA